MIAGNRTPGKPGEDLVIYRLSSRLGRLRCAWWGRNVQRQFLPLCQLMIRASALRSAPHAEHRLEGPVEIRSVGGPQRPRNRRNSREVLSKDETALGPGPRGNALSLVLRDNPGMTRDDAVPGRVAPGDCSPGAPTDPYVPSRAYGSSDHELATGRLPE
jgi:hypothetical protein